MIDKYRSPGKHPRTKQGLKEATTSIAVIEQWWRQWPDANVGIVTGKASGVIVLDIDGEDGEESLLNLESDFGSLPETWEQLTGGGGRHLVFIRPAIEKVSNRVGIAPGVDIRGDDGYIVAEPSNHISGRTYAWEAAHHPDEIKIAELPAAWLEVLTPPPRQYETVELPTEFGQGERNDLLFKLAASLRAKGLSDSALLAALREENRARCKPPLPEREVETIAHSATRYTPGVVGVSQAVAVVTAPPPQNSEKALDQLRVLLQSEEYYSDAVVGMVVSLDRQNSPAYVAALQELRGIEGFRARDFDRAIRAYKARQRGLTVIKGGDGEVTLDKQLPDLPLKGLVMPGDWRLSPSGQIFRYDERSGQEPVVLTACPHPVFPIERLHNIDTCTEKLRVAFRRDGEWRDVVVDAAQASSRSSIVQMANFGLQVTSESAKQLVTFLCEFATANQKMLPVRRSTARLGWIDDKQFAPYADGIVHRLHLTGQLLVEPR